MKINNHKSRLSSVFPHICPAHICMSAPSTDELGELMQQFYLLLLSAEPSSSGGGDGSGSGGGGGKRSCSNLTQLIQAINHLEDTLLYADLSTEELTRPSVQGATPAPAPAPAPTASAEVTLEIVRDCQRKVFSPPFSSLSSSLSVVSVCCLFLPLSPSQYLCLPPSLSVSGRSCHPDSLCGASARHDLRVSQAAHPALCQGQQQQWRGRGRRRGA